MKPYTKIALLVALALFLTLTACTRQASKPPVAVTPSGEAPFPFTTPGAGGVTNFGTQTAIASAPGAGVATATPDVQLATLTPAAGDGAAAAPTAAPATGNAGTEAGGGQNPPAAAPAVNTPVVNRPPNYTLQRGEWPICIARRFGLDIGTFFAQNGLNMNSKPAAGTSLKIPTSGDWNAVYGARSLKQHPTTYQVRAGESVYSIACAFGDVTPEAIIAVNNLANASDVKAGMSLQIP